VALPDHSTGKRLGSRQRENPRPGAFSDRRRLGGDLLLVTHLDAGDLYLRPLLNVGGGVVQKLDIVVGAVLNIVCRYIRRVGLSVIGLSAGNSNDVELVIGTFSFGLPRPRTKRPNCLQSTTANTAGRLDSSVSSSY
jgi:hypothetical protein